MREIKFRAIIKYDAIQQEEAKRMGDKNTEYGIIYFTLVDLIGTITTLPKFSVRELVIPWLFQGNKPDLYTGLKDKNGKEIYEGDILTQDNEFIDGIVKWMDDRGTYYLVDNEGYVTDSDCAYDGMEWNKLEIIGNIYENPELLK